MRFRFELSTFNGTFLIWWFIICQTHLNRYPRSIFSIFFQLHKLISIFLISRFLLLLCAPLMSSARFAHKTIFNWLCWFLFRRYVSRTLKIFNFSLAFAWCNKINISGRAKQQFSLTEEKVFLDFFLFYKNKLQVKNIYVAPRKNSFDFDFSVFLIYLTVF